HFENARDPDLEMQDVADAGENVYGRERVAAQREEIIMDTDPLDLEDLGPEFRQHLLEVRLRRDEGLLRDDKVPEPQLCRQADTLHLARWALWEFLDEVHLARDLEVGEAPDGKLANVCRSRRRVGPQYHGRRDVLAQRGVGHGKGCGFRHRRMLQEHFVDLPWREFLATAVDDLLLATDQNQ